MSSSDDVIVLEIFEGAGGREEDEVVSEEEALLRDERDAAREERDAAVKALKRLSHPKDTVDGVRRLEEALLAATAELEECRAAKLALEEALEASRVALSECETSRFFLEGSLAACQARLEAVEGDCDVDVEEMSKSSSFVNNGGMPNYTAEDRLADIQAELEQSQADQAELRQDLADHKRLLATANTRIKRYSAVANTRLEKIAKLEKRLKEETNNRHIEVIKTLDTATPNGKKIDGVETTTRMQVTPSPEGKADGKLLLKEDDQSSICSPPSTLKRIDTSSKMPKKKASFFDKMMACTGCCSRAGNGGVMANTSNKATFKATQHVCVEESAHAIVSP